MRIKRDQITGIALVILGLVVAYFTNQFKVGFSLSYPGPKALPMIAVIGFVVCGAGIFIQSTRNKKEEPVFLLKSGWLKVFISLAIIAVYIFGMKYLGYLVMTPFVCYAITTLYAKGSVTTVKGRILYTVILTVVLYLIYVYAFGLGLPTGKLTGF